MARIRTIKPDFFRHEKLFEAEQQSGLPLRLAFAGLWTAADREGRFKWQPRQLKLDCLPYDDVSFGAVLDALAHHGFIVKYREETESYGYIPSWNKHQHVNTREAQSSLPAPTDENIFSCTETHVRARGEQEGVLGREGNGTDIGAVADATRSRDIDLFDQFWEAYPRRDGANPREPARKKFSAIVKTGIDPKQIIAAAQRYAAEMREKGQERSQFVAQAMTWLNQQRWGDYAEMALNSEFAARRGLVRIMPETSQWTAWTKSRNGKTLPTDRDGGWWCPTEWPPGYDPETVGASDDRAA